MHICIPTPTARDTVIERPAQRSQRDRSKALRRRARLPARARSPPGRHAEEEPRGCAETIPGSAASRDCGQRRRLRVGSRPARAASRPSYASPRARAHDSTSAGPRRASADSPGPHGPDATRESAANHSRRAWAGRSSRPRTGRRLGDLLRADRRNEPLATLGAAALQHDATGLGAHAGTEAMGSLPTDTTGLKCALHEDFPARRGSPRKQDGRSYPPAFRGVKADDTTLSRPPPTASGDKVAAW